MPKQYIQIGYTKKSHGAHGELKAVVEDQYLEDFLNSDVVFLNVQNKPLPFFIENVRPGADLILKFEDVNTPAEAKKYTSSELLLRPSDLSEKSPVEEGGEFTFTMLVGFQLWDTKLGKIGPIIEVQEYTHQDLAVVEHDNREILIPLHNDLIESFDPTEKKITLQLPEGLLEL